VLESDEWTQEELFEYKEILQKDGIDIYLIDTIAKEIDGADTMLYNPYEMIRLPKGSYFVFYCDSGNATMTRLNEYKKKFPDYYCKSLKGGRAYWRKSYKGKV
jgi:hypothetical protein